MTTGPDRTPHHGARFELAWEHADERGARYRVRVDVPGARHEYSLSITLPEGTCALDETGREPAEAPAPESWVLAHAQALGRQVFRESRRGPWPRRLSRWRDHGG